MVAYNLGNFGAKIAEGAAGVGSAALGAASSFNPLSLAIGAPIMGGTLLAQGIAQAIEDQRPENRLNQEDWIDRQTGGSMRAIGARAQQQTASGIRGAQKDASGLSRQMGTFGRYAGGLVDEDFVRRMKRRANTTAAMKSQQLAAGAAQDQNTKKAASQARIAGFSKFLGQAGGPFTPEVEIPGIGKFDTAKALQFGTGAVGQLGQAALQRQGNSPGFSQKRAAENPLFQAYDFGY
tara:strand:+ start:18221 stop:18928 length:708 start_codon:yes stop_codon:yes gene_type:complete